MLSLIKISIYDDYTLNTFEFYKEIELIINNNMEKNRMLLIYFISL